MIPGEAEQIAAIDEAVSVQPSVPFINDSEINRALSQGSGFQQSKLRIAVLYDREPDRKKRAQYLKREYGNGGRSYEFQDGSRGFLDYNTRGLSLRRYERQEERRLSWNEVEKRIDTLIQAGFYLTLEEQKQYARMKLDYSDVGGIPLPEPNQAFPTVQEELETDMEQNVPAEESEPSASERFTVVESENGYIVWDDLRDGVYVDEEGVDEEFTSEWEAD